MKRKPFALPVLICAGCLLLASCGSTGAGAAASPASKTEASAAVSAASSADTLAAGPESTSSEASQAVSSAAQDSASASKVPAVISPLASALDLNALDDCTFAAVFKSSDVSANSGGTAEIRMTVCDYEKYDMTDIARLASGDTIVVNGDSVAVTKVEQSGSDIIINGDTGENCFTLHTDSDGVYYIYDEEAGPNYYELGEVTLPLGDNFIFTDNSDPRNQGRQMAAADFLSAMQSSFTSFSASNTAVRTEAGKIVELTKQYMP